MLEIGLGYLFCSIVLIIYTSWRGFRQNRKCFKHLAVGFTFLACSTVLMLLSSSWWVYAMSLHVPSQFLELAGFVLFALFTATAILASKEVLETEPSRASL